MNTMNILKRGAILLYAGALAWACTDTKEREAVLPVSQLTVEPAEIAFPKDGGEQTFRITTNRGWALTKTDGVWFEIVGETTGTDSVKVVTLKAPLNGGATARTSKITVSAGATQQTVNVSQFGSQAEILLEKSELAAAMEQGSYEVIANSNVKVTATSDAPEWMEVTEIPTKALVSTVYKVTLKENRNVQERKGKITFQAEGAEDKVLNITQAAFAPKITFSEERLMVSGLHREASVKVSANLPWKVVLQENAPEWIGVNGASEGGIGDVVLKFKLQEYSDMNAGPRTCKFYIQYEGGESIEKVVNQSPANRRDQDSLNLVTLWKAASKHGDAVWDFTQPIDKWGSYGANRFSPSVTWNYNQTRIEKLELYQWEFPDGLPEVIGEFNALRELAITRCTFGKPEFPASFGELTDLRTFALSNCFSPVTFPSLAKWTNIETFKITNFYAGFGGTEDQIQVINNPEVIGELTTLTRLELLATNLTEIPAGVMNMENLEYLDASYSNLKTIQKELSGLKNLKFLLMNTCKLEGKIPAELFEGTSLVLFEVAHNNLSGTIPDEVYTLPSLRTFRASENNLTGDIPVALKDSGITEFVVRLNKMGSVGKLGTLPNEVLQDPRWKGTGGTGGGGWFGTQNICEQQSPYGWKNCK